MKEKIILVFSMACLAFVSCSEKHAISPQAELLFIANLNGNIEACHCGEIMLGGLQNMAVLVDSFRTENPDIILIDGGDTFNYYAFPALNNAIAASYSIIKPDLWIIAEQDFIEGFTFLRKFVNNSELNLLSGNYEISNLKSIAQKKYVFQDLAVSITSYVQPELFENRYTQNKAEQFKSLVDSLVATEFNILILHADSDEYNKHKHLFSKFDLILTAHQQSANINLQSKPAFIDGHSDGEILLYIQIFKNENGYLIKNNIRPIHVSDTPDKKIEKLVADYKKTLIKKD